MAISEMRQPYLPSLAPDSDLRTLVMFEKHPFVALAPGMEALTYAGVEGGRPFRLHAVSAHPGRGLATIADGQLLAWVTSRLMQHLNASLPLPEKLSLHPAEVLHFLGKPTGGRQVALLRSALERLQSTRLEINLGTATTFNLLASLSAPPGRALWTVTPAAWIVEEVAANRVLKITPTMLRRDGLERRVAGWARAYCGAAAFPTFRLSLTDAYRKAGSNGAPRKLLHALRRLVAANPLDEYRLAIVRGDKREDLVIERVQAKRASLISTMPTIDLSMYACDEPEPSTTPTNSERAEPCV